MYRRLVLLVPILFWGSFCGFPALAQIVTGTGPYKAGARGWDRGMQTTMHCAYNFQSWVRGSASLDTRTGILWVTVQLETDSVILGPKGQVTITVKDANGKSLTSVSSDEVGIGGKPRGGPFIKNIDSGLTIPIETARQASSLYIDAQCTGSVTRPFNAFTIGLPNIPDDGPDYLHEWPLVMGAPDGSPWGRDGLIMHDNADFGDTAQREGWYWLGVSILHDLRQPLTEPRTIDFDTVLKKLEPNGDGILYALPVKIRMDGRRTGTRTTVLHLIKWYRWSRRWVHGASMMNFSGSGMPFPKISSENMSSKGTGMTHPITPIRSPIPPPTLMGAVVRSM
jgi:hypothetical protein